MKKNTVKAISFVLTFALLLQMACLPAFAKTADEASAAATAETPSVTLLQSESADTVSDAVKVKTAAELVDDQASLSERAVRKETRGSLSPQSIEPQATYSGTCGASGKNLTWKLDTAKGTLTISGSGKMADYATTAPPWDKYWNSITHVVISKGVTSIGHSAFFDCWYMTSVSLPSGLISIGEDAFALCDSLTSVTIPASVTSIGEGAFDFCASLASIAVNSSNTHYTSDSYGVLFNKKKTHLIRFPEKSSKKSYTIPSTVTSIKRNAFLNSPLTSVTIPSSVTSIEFAAFWGCISLASIVIPKSVTAVGAAAFWECKGPIYCAVASKPSGWSSSWNSGYTGKVTWGSTGKKSYKVTFNPNGGTVSPTSVTKTTGAAIGTLPKPTRSGYAFQGWYTATTGGTKISDTTKVTKAIIYYAQWKKTYKVTFNANGGTVSPASVTKTTGAAIGTLPKPTRSGYAFQGWYTAKTGGTKIATTTKVTKATTYYAQWKKTYKVTFNANGGTVSPASVTKTTGAAIGTLPKPTRSGYTFQGWYTEKTGGTKISDTTKVTKAITYYAQWKKK
jgi:uncharacterized repeat protein (TIGR02543 family)